MQNFVMPTEEELRTRLTPEEYDVLRNKGTEIPYTGDFLTDTTPGTYKCKVCGQPLFESTAKFNSMMGWPAFDMVINDAVVEAIDTTGGLTRTEVMCTQCKSHLGHVFDDGPTETGKRYNIASVCLTFDPSMTPPPRAPKPPADTEVTSA